MSHSSPTTPTSECIAFTILLNPTLTNSSPTTTTTTSTTTSDSNTKTTVRFSSGSSSNGSNNHSVKSDTLQSSILKKPPIESQLEWINWLRKSFVDFIEKKIQKGMEMELKLHFLEHFLNPLTEKVAWKTANEVLIMLNMFCKLVLEWLSPVEWIEIEKMKDANQKFYYTQQLARMLEGIKLFEHEYLKDFIQNQGKVVSIPESDEEYESSLIEEVKLICSMFFYELSDWFSEFEFTNRKKINAWLLKGVKSETIPKYVAKIYKTKSDRLNKANEEFIFKKDDLSQNYVIASDWNYSRFIGKELSTEWTLTCSKFPESSFWMSSVDRSSDKLGLKTLKVVGYMDCSVSKITKATFSDSHFQQFFKEATFHDYSAIDKTHSHKKYPLVFMSNKFKFAPMFSTREINIAYSSVAKFHSNMMVESTLLFKSRDYVNPLDEENKKLIKVPIIGARMYYMIDKNKVRYVEYRTLNSGGLLNSNLLLYSKFAAKKTLQDIRSAIEKSLADCEQYKNQITPINLNNLTRSLHNYCQEYCNIDLENDQIL